MGALQRPDGHGVQQGHVLGAFDGKLAAGIEVDDLGDAVEGAAVLAQDELVVFGSGQFHVHKPLAAPVRKTEGSGSRLSSAVTHHSHATGTTWNPCEMA